MKWKKKISKEDIVSIIRIAVIASIGLGLSILFIYLYETYNNLTITITTGIISVVYMVLSLLIINKYDFIFQDIEKASILFPIIYTAIVFLILLFLMHTRISDNPMIILDCIIWAIYTMPSFIIVMLILMLLVVCLSYA